MARAPVFNLASDKKTVTLATKLATGNYNLQLVADHPNVSTYKADIAITVGQTYVTLPSMDEWNALVARVAALELATPSADGATLSDTTGQLVDNAHHAFRLIGG